MRIKSHFVTNLKSLDYLLLHIGCANLRYYLKSLDLVHWHNCRIFIGIVQFVWKSFIVSSHNYKSETYKLCVKYVTEFNKIWNGSLPRKPEQINYIVCVLWGFVCFLERPFSFASHTSLISMPSRNARLGNSRSRWRRRQHFRSAGWWWLRTVIIKSEEEMWYRFKSKFSNFSNISHFFIC